MNENKVPALPLKAKIDKQGKLVIEYGIKVAKFKPLDYSAKDKQYSGLLLTKFLWDTTKALWDAEMQREQTIKDVKKSFVGIDDSAADSLVRRIHEDLFGEQ